MEQSSEKLSYPTPAIRKSNFPRNLVGISMAVVAIFCLFSFMWSHSKDISVTTTEKKDIYEFTATFGKNKVMPVYRYINKSISPNSLFESEDDNLDVTTTLSDHTTFHIQAYHGKVEITLKKNENSVVSFQRVKDMCEGIKNVLTSKD